MSAPLESPSFLLLRPVLPCLLLFLPPPALRAVPWARQPDRHGKPVPLRQQGEWTTPTTSPHSPHRLWAQLPDLRRAQRLFRFLLLHYPVIGPRRGWPDTRQAAHRGTPRTSRLLRTKKVHQSVSRRLLCSMDQGNLMERNVDQSVNFGATRNTYSAHSKFSENTQAEKVVDGSGKPDERNISNAQIRDSTRGAKTDNSCGISRKSQSLRTPSSSSRRRTPTPTRTIMATEIGISWSSSTKSYRDGGITKIPEFCFRYYNKKKFIEDQNTVLCKIQLRLVQHFIRRNWIHEVLVHRRAVPFVQYVEKSERQEQNRDLRCQSGPSPKDSVIFSWLDSSKNYGADKERLQNFGSSLWQIHHKPHLLDGS